MKLNIEDGYQPVEFCFCVKKKQSTTARVYGPYTVNSRIGGAKNKDNSDIKDTDRNQSEGFSGLIFGSMKNMLTKYTDRVDEIALGYSGTKKIHKKLKKKFYKQKDIGNYSDAVTHFVEQFDQDPRDYVLNTRSTLGRSETILVNDAFLALYHIIGIGPGDIRPLNTAGSNIVPDLPSNTAPDIKAPVIMDVRPKKHWHGLKDYQYIINEVKIEKKSEYDIRQKIKETKTKTTIFT